MTSMKNVFRILVLILFISLGIMTMGKGEGVLFDKAILDYIHYDANQTLVKGMEFISFIGSETFLFPTMAMIISYFIIKKKLYIATLLTVSSLGSYLLNHLLKQVFQRSRPFDYFLVEQSGLSYPSGHSMVTMTMFLTVAYLLLKHNDSDSFKLKIKIFIGLYIGIMGISRLFLGVHWPTDVIGGFLGGYLFYNYYINAIKEHWFSKRKIS